MKKILLLAITLLLSVSAFGQNSRIENNSKAKVSSIYDLLTRQTGVYVDVASNKIYIRGIGTLSKETQPLLIVDDVRVEDISNLNPDEVWSVEVIKDGTANIYGGMESANGVIKVETKAYHEVEAMREENEAN